MENDEKQFEISWSALSSQIKYWRRTLRLIWAAAPKWTLTWAVLLVVQGIQPAALVYLTKFLVDDLLASRKHLGDWHNLKPLVGLVVLIGVLTLLSELAQSLIELVRTAQSDLVHDHIKSLVHRKSISVDIAFYESADFHDRLERARNEAASRPIAILENFGALIQSTITLAAMLAVLIPYGVWLPLVLLVSTLPAFYTVFRHDRKYHRWWHSTTPLRRWLQYYDVMLTHSQAAPELRLFGLGPHFHDTYQSIRRRLRTERIDHLRKQGLARFGAGLFSAVTSGLAVAWVGYRAIRGLATFGDLALLYQAFNRGQALMRTLLGSIGQIYSNSLFLSNLFAFLDMEPRIVSPLEPAHLPPVRTGIHFDDITFTYPESERAALTGFSLYVPSGKIVSIVGANGAGKSTILKLLCRFYDPDQGRITVDGTNLRDLPLDGLRSMMTVLFQNPLNYHATVAESIALGDVSTTPSMAEIQRAARDAGADGFVNALPAGYNTLLGKWFANGAELSGGEWQRIAMARACFRRSPLILLDEPTSFLDSWAEADWFRRFRRFAEDRTTILITHRFTIAMRADVIHVLDQGRIVESGTHFELLEQGGLYAQSWRSQMEAASPTAAFQNQPTPVF